MIMPILSEIFILNFQASFIIYPKWVCIFYHLYLPVVYRKEQISVRQRNKGRRNTRQEMACYTALLLIAIKMHRNRNRLVQKYVFVDKNLQWYTFHYQPSLLCCFFQQKRSMCLVAVSTGFMQPHDEQHTRPKMILPLDLYP